MLLQRRSLIALMASAVGAKPASAGTTFLPASTPQAEASDDLAADAPREVSIFIFAGQSNMVGRMEPDAVPDSESVKRAIYYSYVTGAARAPNGMDRWNLAPLGPEYGFAKTMLANRRNGYRMLKSAVGGTAISREAFPGRPNWHPDSQDQLFDTLVGDYRRLCAYIESRGRTPALRAVFWAQGAADIRDLANYQGHLDYFFERLQAEIGEPPLFVVETAHTTRSNDAIWASGRIRDMQADFVSRNANATLIPTNGLTFVEDQLHFDPESLYALGQSLAVAYLKRTGVPAPVEPVFTAG